MKSVVMTYLIIVLGSLFCVVCCRVIAFDHVESMTYDHCKHALAYAMKQNREADGLSAAAFMQDFEAYFKNNLLRGYHYEIRLIGFMDEPLFASVEVEMNGKGMQIQVRETMIEEVREDGAET